MPCKREDRRAVRTLQNRRIKNQFVMNLVRKGEVRFEFVPSEHMLANVMTKNLSIENFLPRG